MESDLQTASGTLHLGLCIVHMGLIALAPPCGLGWGLEGRAWPGGSVLGWQWRLRASLLHRCSL